MAEPPMSASTWPFPAADGRFNGRPARPGRCCRWRRTRHTGPALCAHCRRCADPAEWARSPEEDRPRGSRDRAAALPPVPTAAARAVAELYERSAEFVRARERHEVAEHFEDRKNLVTRLDVEILLVTTTRTIEEGRGKRQLPSDLGNQQPAR